MDLQNPNELQFCIQGVFLVKGWNAFRTRFEQNAFWIVRPLKKNPGERKIRSWRHRVTAVLALSTPPRPQILLAWKPFKICNNSEFWKKGSQAQILNLKPFRPHPGMLPMHQSGTWLMKQRMCCIFFYRHLSEKQNGLDMSFEKTQQVDVMVST